MSRAGLDHVTSGLASKQVALSAIRCDPGWRAASPILKNSLRTLKAILEANEPPRLRKRRAADAVTFRAAVECIACNLLAISIAAPDLALAIPLANSASKIAPFFGKPARKVISLMEDLKLVTKARGYPFKGATKIRPTRSLAKILPLGGIGWDDLTLHKEERSSVVLRRQTAPDASLDDEDGLGPNIVSRSRNPKTKRWLARVTAEMSEINAAILKAPVTFKGGEVAHIAGPPGAPMATLVTAHHRTLRRIFNGSWDEGGRLFGGFWQTMPRDQRFKHLRIDEQPAVAVDFSQLFTRLAYARAKANPPRGDLYDLTGSDATKPGWKDLRDARKKLVNALFFKNGPLKQWPGATLKDSAKMRRAFPSGTKPRDAIKAINEKHPAIAHLFEKGIGMQLMRTESDLIVAVTLKLFAKGITALPIHDAVLVARPHAETARRVMQQEAKRLVGTTIPAEIQFGRRS